MSLCWPRHCGSDDSSDGSSGESYIAIDLGSVQEVAGVEFVTRTTADGSATAGTFSVVVDGGERLGPFQAGRPIDPGLVAVSLTGASCGSR